MWCVDNIGSAELDLWKQYTWPALEGFFLHRDFQSPPNPPTPPRSNLTPRVSLCQDLFPPPLDCTAGFVPLGQLDLFSSDEGFVTEGNYFLVIRVNAPLGQNKCYDKFIIKYSFISFISLRPNSPNMKHYPPFISQCWPDPRPP